METLKENIDFSSDWIVFCFMTEKFTLDYTLSSFIEIDKFFTLHSKNGKPTEDGILAKNLDSILFALGSYIGETIIKNVPSARWILEDDNPDGSRNIAVKMPDNTTIWPVQRIIKRLENGIDDSIYVYFYILMEDYMDITLEDSYWELYQKVSKEGLINIK